MKRFLRYVFYRELYRQLRQLGQGESDDPQPTQSQQQPRRQLPVEAGPIETDDRLKRVLQEMDPYDFEHFVAELWERMGWETEVSDAARDRGVDVIARKALPYEQTTLIQAKRYGPNTTVGSPDIQQYASLEDQYPGVDKVVIVTTNEFTGQAKELAATLNVKLINGDDLIDLLERYEAGDLVAEYLDFVHTRDEPSEATAAETAPDESDPTEQARTAPATAGEQSHSRLWPSVIGAATAGWIVSVLFVEVLSEPLWGVITFGSWIALPLGILMDSRSLPDELDWPAHRWAYLLSSLVLIVAIVPGVLYLWRRWRTVGPQGS